MPFGKSLWQPDISADPGLAVRDRPAVIGQRLAYCMRTQLNIHAETFWTTINKLYLFVFLIKNNIHITLTVDNQ